MPLVLERLQDIRHEAEKEATQFDLERVEMQMMTHKLQAEINKYMAENSRLREVNSRNKNRRPSQGRKHEDVQSQGRKLEEEVQSLRHHSPK